MLSCENNIDIKDCLLYIPRGLDHQRDQEETMSSTLTSNADQQIEWRKAAQADRHVHMYEDRLPIIGDSSIYLATTVSDTGVSNHQPWHFFFYHQLRMEADWKHPIFIPEQRKSVGGSKKAQHSVWRRQALAQAEHLVFNLKRGMPQKEINQLYQQIDLAIGRRGESGQQIWVVSTLGLDFNEATEKNLKEAGISIFKDFSQIGNELFAFA